MSEEKTPMRGRRRSIALAALALVAGAGLAAVYGIGGRAGNAIGASCDAATAKAAALEPLATGEVAALMVAEEPRPVPELTFRDGDGGTVSLSDWRGRVVLLNLWATWCAPCREEMPALDALQEELGGEDFEVVAVSVDTGDPDKARSFLDEIGVETLERYADPTTGVFRELKSIGRAFGMPTTLIVGREGCELAHMAGPADWASPEALELIRTAIAEE